jgi:hypothetical protein
MNVVRISVIAIAYDWSGVDWSSGTPHEILGLLIFLITFIALVSTDYALLVLSAPIKQTFAQQYGDPHRHGAWLVDAWDWLQGWGSPVTAAESSDTEATQDNLRQDTVATVPSGIMPPSPSLRSTLAATRPRRALAARFVLSVIPLIAFGVLAGAQFTMANWFRQPISGSSQSLARARELNAEMLPKSIREFDRNEFSVIDRSAGDVFGDHSRSYEYRNEGGNNFLVSCDFPFGPGWHDLTTCYRGVGWELTSYRTTESSLLAEEGDKWGLVEATFSKPDGTAAYLAYCVFDERGQYLSPPMSQDLDSLWQVFLQQFGAQRPGRLFQVQVWTTTVGKVPEERQQAARELLLDVRERFRKLVTQEGSKVVDG